MLGVKSDDEEKPAEAGTVVIFDVDPKELPVAALVPNGVTVDGLAPNVNEELVALGTEATVVEGVAPNASVED